MIVSRPTKWGNPFPLGKWNGLVRYRQEDPYTYEYESRISSDGQHHPYYGPDGTITSYYVRYATRAELVELYRRTLIEPDRGMLGGYPSAKGHYAKVTPEDIRRELAGKDLVCWCPTFEPCHADLLLEIANGGAS